MHILGKKSYKIGVFILAAVMAVCLTPFPAMAEESVLIAVTSPVEGDIWLTGTSRQIVWNFGEAPGSGVKIELLAGGEVCRSIADSAVTGADGYGTVDWTVPGDLTPGENYTVRITSLADTGCFAVSKTFTVGAPPPAADNEPGASLAVASPAGEADWSLRTSHEINWTFSGEPGGEVKIDLVKDNVSVLTIAEGTSIGKDGAGSFSWQLPAGLTPGDNYQIRIASLADPSCTATGEMFAISGPLKVTIPAEGDSLTAGSCEKITWNFGDADLGETFRIDLLQNGSLLSTIAESVPAGTDGTGSYDWTIPADIAPGDAYQIRVSSIDYPEITVLSGNLLFTQEDDGTAHSAEITTSAAVALSGLPGSWTDAVTVTSLSGGGTALDPYLIQSEQDFAFLAKMVNSGDAAYIGAVCRLTANIDLSAHTWIPLGTNDHPFSGTFDGGGNTISGLMIGSAGSPFAASFAGLFGLIDAAAAVTDLTVANAAVYGTDPALNIGGLVGYNAGSIENCYFTGTVAGYDKTAYVGGIAGGNEGSIANCFSAGNVSGGNEACIGGMVGCNYGYILNSDAKCTVSGGAASYTGGFVGNNYSGVVYNCYAAGNVTGGSATADLASYTGGFAGYSYFSILNCYATGNVTGGDAVPGHKSLVGGFIGKNYGDVLNCFAAGNVTGGTGATVGGFAGGNNSYSSFVRLINTYWNMDAVQTVGGVARTTGMLGNGESTGADLPYGLPESVLRGGAPATGITYVRDDLGGTATTGLTAGAFMEALNGGIGALDTANTYLAWTAGGYPVFSTDIAPAFYSVTVESEGNGTCSASPTAALAGEKVTLSATAGSNYHFKEWQVVSPSGLSITGNSFTMPDEAVHIKAVFEINPPQDHDVIVENDGNGTANASPAAAPAGETITLNAVPNSGCHFKEWQVISPSGLQITGNSFTMPDGAVHIKAIFARNTCTITFSIDGKTYAAITVPAGSAAGSEVWPADPGKSGYTFGGWYAEVNGSEMKFTPGTIVTADITVYARWVQSTDGGNSTGGNSQNGGGAVQLTADKKNNDPGEDGDKPEASPAAASPAPTSMPSPAPSSWSGQITALKPSHIEKDQETGVVTVVIELDTLPAGTTAIRLQNGDIIPIDDKGGTVSFKISGQDISGDGSIKVTAINEEGLPLGGYSLQVSNTAETAPERTDTNAAGGLAPVLLWLIGILVAAAAAAAVIVIVQKRKKSKI